MSWISAPDPDCLQQPDPEAIETLVVPRSADIGGFDVYRVLPSRLRRMVGPFIFLDQMGPGELLTGQGLDVPPHPHIGLATVTYLFSGEVLHRDSLGTEQRIRPGDLNVMTAGRGIAHSERTPEDRRQAPSSIFGLQSWVALPLEQETADPGFVHYPAHHLPRIEGEGKTVRLIMGRLFGETAPVATASDTLYADIQLTAGATLPISAETEERALYLIRGRIELAGQTFDRPQLLVLRPGRELTLRAGAESHLLLLGGAPLEGRRFIWWNFVSSDRERIEAAKADWKARRFDPVPCDDGYVALPRH